MLSSRRVTLLTLGLTAFLAGCAAPQRPDDRLPDDFSLSVSVLGPEGTPMESAWYLVDPDGTLRVAMGERLRSSPAPRAVRVLTREQQTTLWRRVVESGLLAERERAPALSEAAIPVPGERAAVVHLAADQHRRSFRADPDPAGPTATVVTHLRALAWLEP